MLKIKETDNHWEWADATIVSREGVCPYYVTIVFQSDWNGLNASYKAGDKIKIPAMDVQEVYKGK